MNRAAVIRFGCLLALVAGCSSKPSARERKVRLWHTFNPAETAALNQALEHRDGVAVEPTLVPFQRGQTILREVLEARDRCPDLVRMDATWMPGLARAGLLAPVPERIAGELDWLPEASAMAVDGDILYGLPQRLDGLALIYRQSTVRAAGVDWPPTTMGALLAAARRMTGGGNHGLGVRVDGYWFAAFLRAWGGDLLDPVRGTLGIDRPDARAALTRFAGLFGAGNIAGPPPPSGSEQQDEVRRFRAGSLAVVVDGPWVASDLGGGDTSGLGVAPFPRAPDGRPAAPRGGQLFVVPACAAEKEEAWALARELLDPALQAAWSRQLGLVPTTRPALADAGPFSQAFYRALQVTRPLPAHPATAEMFDDLNPAIAAVVAGDATPDEALDGVARAWTRLLARYDIEVGAAPRDAGPAGDAGGAR